MSLSKDPVTKKQLHTLVSERLRNAILEGTYKPGEWLRQKRLAEEFGVSDMPVREALKELAAEGLVEHVPYRGVRVVRFSATDVADLYAFRAFLEGRAAGAAAQIITGEELAELRRLLDRMQQDLGIPKRLPSYRARNRKFHQTIYSASHRDYLIRTLNQMWSAFPSMLLGNFVQTAARPLPDRTPRDQEEHEAIFDALQRHDAEQAEQLLRQHVEAAGRQLLAAFEPEN